jgi:hypothetical protein
MPVDTRAHVIVGGYPPTSSAAHDMDYARLRLLGLMADHPDVRTTVAHDYRDLAQWLDGATLLVTYVAGPCPDAAAHGALQEWLAGGGRWLALHGTSGGKATKVEVPRRGRMMVKMAHHATLGCFFLNHPPLSRFSVHVAGDGHPLTKGLPASFEVADELYLIELQDPDGSELLLTTELEADPSPPGFGFLYERDTSALADGRTRALGYVRTLGSGAVAYLALGHCHSPATNSQPFVDASVMTDGQTPLLFRGSWETPEFTTLLTNGIAWGLGRA